MKKGALEEEASQEACHLEEVAFHLMAQANQDEEASHRARRGYGRRCQQEEVATCL